MMASPVLISPGYLAMQRQMHARGDYGRWGAKWADAVDGLVSREGLQTVLDYGAGQGTLAHELRRRGIRVTEYDPAIVGKDAPPAPADLVVCTDVLEHIEPDSIQFVLAHLFALTRRFLFAVIATQPAVKSLPDGRNAHVLLADATWWRAAMNAAGFAERSTAIGKKRIVGTWSVPGV